MGVYVLPQQLWGKRESCSQKRKAEALSSYQPCLITNQSMFGFFPLTVVCKQRRDLTLLLFPKLFLYKQTFFNGPSGKSDMGFAKFLS